MVNRAATLTTNYQLLTPKLIAIVGPTGSGKSALALELAKRFDGEIICADSRTIYRGLDIGTAKPTPEEQKAVTHYGLDLINPDEIFSAADFQNLANIWIADAQRRGKLPILVGGTGLYIDSVLYNFEFGGKANAKLRKRLEKLSIAELQAEITKNGFEMPENSLNKRYLVRALEQGGINRTKSQLRQGTLLIGLNPNQDVLENRLASRLQMMKRSGVLEEARWLFEAYGYDCPAASGNIYRALAPLFIEGKHIDESLDECLKLDRQLAKRQLTWFKRNPDIHWFSDTNSALAFAENRPIENSSSGQATIKINEL